MAVHDLTLIEGKLNRDVIAATPVSNTDGGLAFKSMSEVLEFSKLMSLSDLAVPKHLRGNPGACLAIVIQAIEWRMSPYSISNKSYAVNDRLAYESQLIQAVILQRAPITGRFRYTFSGAGLTRRCKAEVTTRDGEVVSYESPEVKEIPVKNSPLWKSDVDQQLTYYSGRALCRRYFPDVLLGIYAVDELEPETRDPERARDVTDRKSLSEKLDMLAIVDPTDYSSDSEEQADDDDAKDRIATEDYDEK